MPSRRRRIGLAVGFVLILALAVATFSGALDGRGEPAARADVVRPATATRSEISARPVPGAQWCGARSARACEAIAATTGYVNPLAHARVIGERIDQGVDYAGSGTLTAIGPARITHVARSAPGWPGAFIEYRLRFGPAAGRYVFYAEGVSPVRRLHVGQAVRAGDPIATIIRGYPTGIELGWGAGTGDTTYAHKIGNWTPYADANNLASRTGKNFSALIAALGGPPGKVEG